MRYNCLGVELFRLRYRGHLPSERQFNADFIRPLKWKLKINGLDAFGVIEEMLFGSTEQTQGKESVASCRRSPAWHSQREFCRQRIGALPVRLIKELYFASCGNGFSNLLFQKLLATGVIRETLLHTPFCGFHAGVGHQQIAFEVTGVCEL